MCWFDGTHCLDLWVSWKCVGFGLRIWFHFLRLCSIGTS
jgi:hypothetical protein